MISKRAIVLAFFTLLAVGLGFAEATLIPTRYFSNWLFWVGYIISFAIGAILIMNTNPMGATSNKIMKIGALSWGGLVLGAVLVSNRFPEALVFGAGASGLLVGIGVRGFLYFLLNTRWTYCPSCRQTAWIEKRKDGKWYCMKRGDLVETTAALPTKVMPSSGNIRIA